MSPKTLFKTILYFPCLLSTLILSAAPAFAANEPIALRGFHVRQERFEKNGVLVSRPVQSDRTIVDIVSQNQIHTIEDYAAWLEKNMTYQADPAGPDQWLKPEEFLKLKRGDCEDFAFLNSQVLRVLGFTPHVITLSSLQNNHAICAFEHGGKFYWFDNAKLKTSTATDLVAFAQDITDQLHYSRSFELDPSSKQSNLIYQRS